MLNGDTPIFTSHLEPKHRVNMDYHWASIAVMLEQIPLMQPYRDRPKPFRINNTDKLKFGNMTTIYDAEGAWIGGVQMRPLKEIINLQQPTKVITDEQLSGNNAA